MTILTQDHELASFRSALNFGSQVSTLRGYLAPRSHQCRRRDNEGFTKGAAIAPERPSDQQNRADYRDDADFLTMHLVKAGKMRPFVRRKRPADILIALGQVKKRHLP